MNASKGRLTALARRGALAFGLIVAIAGGSWAPTPAAAAQPLVQVGPSAPPALSHSDRQAALDPAQRIEVQLVLNLRDQAGLKDLISRVSTPGSPEYGHYLTPQQFADRFGPTPPQVLGAVDYLSSNGLTVTSSGPGSTLVTATGSATQVAAAMHTSISQYRDRNDGRQFYANDSAPTLPSGVAGLVQGVIGLDNHAVRHHGAAPRACCGGTPYTPAQVRAGYNFNAAPLTGLTGSGQTMGLLELDTFQQINISRFDTQYSLTPPPPTVQQVAGGAVTTNGGEVEVELDIEVMQGIAPAANILVFEAPNNNVGLNKAYSCMWDPNALGSNPLTSCPNQATGNTAPSNSTSWGLCETDQGQTETLALDSIFQSAAATGHSFYAASGDFGTNDGCIVTPAVDSPASDPYVTGTGGTKLRLDSGSNAWFDETAWPAEPRANLGGGGGLSIAFPRPSWQVGAGVANSFSNGNRQVPDISANSDPSWGYSIYTCTANTMCDPTMPGQTGFFSIGGTSAAAPAWAAFTAIYNQYAVSLPKPKLGFANPSLYGVAQCGVFSGGFHDIVSGTNPNNSPFGITAGWDFLTGIGSYNAAVLAGQLASLGAACPVDGNQSTLAASPGVVTADGSTTSTLTVTLRNSVSAPVAGKAVTLSKSAGPGSPTITGPTPALTNPSGQTTFTVKSTTAGTDTFQAKDTTDNALINQTADVVFTAGPATAGNSAVSASPGSVPADNSTTSLITVTLRDANNNVTPGKAATLARLSGPGNPAIAGPSPALTDANGQTTFTVRSITVGSDVFRVTDTTDGNTVITQTATVNFSPLPGNAAHSLMSANPLTVAADGTTTSTVTVTIRDINDTAVAGKTVSLARVSGLGNPTITGPTPATTNGSGQTTFTVRSTTNGTDTFQATDTTDAVVISQTANVTFGAVSDVVSTVTATPSAVPADGGTASTVTVTLLDGGGNGVGGKTVSVAKSNGPGTPSISPATVITNGAGVATFSVTSKNIATDTFRATDQTDGNLAIQQTASVGFAAGGYTLDGYGGVHNYGVSGNVPDGSHAYWPGWRIVRGVAVCPGNANGGVTVDAYGGVHGFGSGIDQSPSLTAYWSGWDIARGVVLTSCSGGHPQGYVLDGYGGLHAFGGVGPDPNNSGYWPGWDIAVAVATCPDLPGSGYVMDGYGGVHGYGSVTASPNLSAYWGGWRIARGVTVTHCLGGVAGYTLDGYGGVHSFGTGALVDPATSAYWPGWDIARGIDILADGSGGFVLDGYGGVHPFAITSMPATPSISGYWPGWDIATGLGGST